MLMVAQTYVEQLLDIIKRKGILNAAALWIMKKLRLT